MIGTLRKEAGRSVVVGGGVSGLLAALRLAQKGQTVELYESRERLGGLIETRVLRHGLAEDAAHSLRASAAVRGLFAELGLDWVSAKPEARAKFLIRNGRLRKWPFGFFETLSALFHATLVPAGNRDAHLAEWAKRHLGGAAPAMRAMARGIYGSEPEELVARLAFPKMAPDPLWPLLPWVLQTKREKGIVAAAARKGMGDLIRALENKARACGVAFHLGVPVPGDLVDPILRGSDTKSNLILTAPPDACARLVASADEDLGNRLEAVPYGALTCVTALIDANAFAHPTVGTGALSMDRGDSRILGILYNSSSFAGRVLDEQVARSLTLMLRGAEPPTRAELCAILAASFDLPEAALLEYAIAAHPRALPRYGLPLEAAWNHCRRFCAAHPGLVFFGNWTGEISLRGLIETARNFSTP